MGKSLVRMRRGVGPFTVWSYPHLKANDGLDRLHHYWTPLLLTIALTLTITGRIFGDPISCIYPTDIAVTRTWRDYFSQSCYLSPKIFPQTVGYGPDHEHPHINYYEWIPYFLLVQLQAFVGVSFVYQFFMPSPPIDLMWNETVIEKTWNRMETDKNEKTYEEAEEKRFGLIDGHVQCLYEVFRYEETRKPSFLGRLFKGKTAALSYWIFKVLELVNSLVQLYFISSFLGMDTLNLYEIGYQYARGFTKPSYVDYHQGVFPLKVYCNTSRHNSESTMQTYIFECLLTLNYLHEKIFLFMWLWFCMLVLSTFLNLFKWSNVLLHCRAVFSIEDHIRRYPQTKKKLFICGMNVYDYKALLSPQDFNRLMDHFNVFLAIDGRMLFYFFHKVLGTAVTTELAIMLLQKVAKDHGFEDMVKPPEEHIEVIEKPFAIKEDGDAKANAPPFDRDYDVEKADSVGTASTIEDMNEPIQASIPIQYPRVMRL